MRTYKRNRPFVGFLRKKSPLNRECFSACRTPTESSHGHRYFMVLGPFRTNRGAEFARANPYLDATVTEYERLAKEQCERREAA